MQTTHGLESGQILRYTLVAIIGLVAGLVIGGAISGSWRAASGATPAGVQAPVATRPSP